MTPPFRRLQGTLHAAKRNRRSFVHYVLCRPPLSHLQAAEHLRQSLVVTGFAVTAAPAYLPWQLTLYQLYILTASSTAVIIYAGSRALEQRVAGAHRLLLLFQHTRSGSPPCTMGNYCSNLSCAGSGAPQQPIADRYRLGCRGNPGVAAHPVAGSRRRRSGHSRQTDVQVRLRCDNLSELQFRHIHTQTAQPVAGVGFAGPIAADRPTIRQEAPSHTSQPDLLLVPNTVRSSTPSG